MGASYKFYADLGLHCTYGDVDAPFTTFSSGPSDAESTMHVNLKMLGDGPEGDGDTWNRWGRCIFYVEDVDAMRRGATLVFRNV